MNAHRLLLLATTLIAGCSDDGKAPEEHREARAREYTTEMERRAVAYEKEMKRHAEEYESTRR